MKLLRIAVLVIAVALFGFASAACGDDDDEGEDNGTNAPAATTRAAAATTAAADGGTGGATGGADDEVEVEAADFSFDPDTFTLPADVPVKIEVSNTGNAPHTLTVYTDDAFTEQVEGADTDNISSGEDASIETSFEAGEYFFRCEVHPSQMQGEFQAE